MVLLGSIELVGFRKERKRDPSVSKRIGSRSRTISLLQVRENIHSFLLKLVKWYVAFRLEL